MNNISIINRVIIRTKENIRAPRAPNNVIIIGTGVNIEVIIKRIMVMSVRKLRILNNPACFVKSNYQNKIAN